MAAIEEEEQRLRQALETHPRDAAAQNDLGNLLLARGETENAIECYRSALANAPDRAEIQYNLANALAAAGDSAAALSSYHRALALDPAHAGAHNNLGNLLRELKRPADAIESYRRALYVNPQDATMRYNLGTALMDMHRAEEALVWFEQAARADPPHRPAFATMGEALMRLGRPAEALEWFRTARRFTPDDVQSRLGEGISLLSLGRLREGWDAFEARLSDPRLSNILAGITQPPWHGETEVSGRTILLIGEQGLGDMIQFGRYAPLLRTRGARVVMQVRAPLVTLMRGLADEVIDMDDPFPAFDLHCPLMSLPRAFGTDLSTIPADIPYLHADPAAIATWQQHLGARRRMRIGIAFSGNPDHSMDVLRSIPATLFGPLLARQDAEFHVLQKDIRPADADTLAQFPQVRTYTGTMGDFTDTAALVSLMDLVISADTAVAHLAGAMAKPTWILLPFSADFRWLQRRGDTPWYPTARLFRQPAMRRWQPVIDAVAAALAGR